MEGPQCTSSKLVEIKVTSMKKEYTNKNVVITGSFSGIGNAVARAYAAEGANVFVIDANKNILRVAEEIAVETASTVIPIVCDISNELKVQEAFSRIENIDILIANAGVESPTPIGDTSELLSDNFRRIIDINITGTFSTLVHAVKKMKPGSSIVITSSIWGKTAVPEFSAYIASKHANLGLMRTLAMELGPKGIRVNAVCPGWVKTGPAMESLKKMAEEQQRSEESLLQELSEDQCFGDVQSPEDVALSYLMLTSKYSINITGQAINADRGALVI